MVSGVESYSVEGTPADSVILALGKLVKDEVDLVISGICSTSQGTPIRDLSRNGERLLAPPHIKKERRESSYYPFTAPKVSPRMI